LLAKSHEVRGVTALTMQLKIFHLITADKICNHHYLSHL
jgi:hypothetical protein